MIKKEMTDALNTQIVNEFYSSYLYLSMAADLEEKGLKGFGNWMRKQSVEEIEHGMKIYDYIIVQGGKIRLSAIKAPKSSWKSPMEIFHGSYAHEKKVTAMIHNLRKLALKLDDNKTVRFLQWYVDEQVEEEENASGVIKKLKIAGNSRAMILKLDSEMGRR